MCCDRFITGTEELNWINKKTLIANRVKLMNPDITNETFFAKFNWDTIANLKFLECYCCVKWNRAY